MITSTRALCALFAGLLVLFSGAVAAGADQVLVNISNTTGSPIEIIAIGPGNEQQLLYELPAGQTYELPTQTGAKLGFAQNGNWLGDAYVVTGASGEGVAVPYMAQAATAPAAVDANAPQVQVTNSTDKSISVIAIGADKSQQAIGEVPAGQTIGQPVQPGTTLGFAQGDGWLGDAYVVTGANGEAVTVPYAAQAAETPAAVDPNAPRIQITNSTDKKVTVIAIAADQTQQALAEVPAGQSISQAVQAGATLGFAQESGWLGDAYVVTGAPAETVTVPYQAQAAAGGPAIEEFVDTSLPPVAITNGSDKPITIVSIQPDKTQHALKEIPAGETYSQPATPGTMLGFAQGDGWLGDFYVTTGDPGEKVAVPYRQLSAEQLRQQGPDSVSIEFNNSGEAPLSVAVTDDQNNATLLYDLPVGQTTQHAVPKSKLWFYKAGETQPTGDPYVVTDADGQQVAVPYSAAAALVAAQSGPGSVTLEFTNTNAVPIVASLVDAENRATVLYEIPTGQIVTQHALPKSQLWFFRKGEDAPVGDPYVVPDADASLSLPYDRLADLRARQSGPGSVTLEMRNETYGDVAIAITDRAGARADLYDVPYRNAAAGQGTDIQVMPGTQLYFFTPITETVDGESRPKMAGAYLVPADGPRIIYLPYEPDMATQKQPEPPGGVSVMFKNVAAGETPDLVFVDQQSQNMFRLSRNLETWRNLTPGTTLFTFGLKAIGDTEYSQIGDPIQIGSTPGQTINVPQSDSAADLITTGKIDLKAIAQQIAVSLAQSNIEADKAKVCWRNTYGRGVGTVPRNCPPGQSEDTAGLCYTNCRPGYHQFVTMCVPDCPAGFRDDGLFCFKPAPIARDEYPWKLGDTAFSLDDARARCAAAHGSNCETANSSTIVYSTCPSGYQQAPIITDLCSPVCPADTTDIGISCQKHTYDRGVGNLMSCNSNQEYDAGLCYNGCKTGFTGVGPVCWAACPASLPVNCGASCAKDIGECAQSVTDQITTPFMTAANVALMVVTAGAGAAATEGANAARAGAEVGARTAGEVAAKVAAKETARASLKASVKALLRSGVSAGVRAGAAALAKDTAINVAVSGVISTAFAVGFSEKAKADLRAALTAEVNQQLSSQISDAEIETVVNLAIEGSDSGGIDFPWTSLDPTGVADIVRSFNLPLCSDVH